MLASRQNMLFFIFPFIIFYNGQMKKNMKVTKVKNNKKMQRKI